MCVHATLQVSVNLQLSFCVFLTLQLESKKEEVWKFYLPMHYSKDALANPCGLGFQLRITLNPHRELRVIIFKILIKSRPIQYYFWSVSLVIQCIYILWIALLYRSCHCSHLEWKLCSCWICEFYYKQTSADLLLHFRQSTVAPQVIYLFIYLHTDYTDTKINKRDKNFINPKGNSCAFYMLGAIKIETGAEAIRCTESDSKNSKNKEYSACKPLSRQLTLWAIFSFMGTVLYFIYIHFVFFLFKCTLRSLSCSINHIMVARQIFD